MIDYITFPIILNPWMILHSQNFNLKQIRHNYGLFSIIYQHFITIKRHLLFLLPNLPKVKLDFQNAFYHKNIQQMSTVLEE